MIVYYCCRWNRQERDEDQRGQARREDLHSVQVRTNIIRNNENIILLI